MKPLNTLLVKEGVKELYEKALQDKLGKILGTDILQNIEKIGGFGDILVNSMLSYQEIISIKGMLLWDEKNAQTDYSSFGGLNHYLYAGFAQLSYLNWHLLGEENTNTKIEKILDESPTYTKIRPDFTDGLYASKDKKDKKINEVKNKIDNTKKLLNIDDKSKEASDSVPIDYAYMIKLDGKEIPIYHADDRRSFYLYSERQMEPHLNPRFKEFHEWEFIYAFDHNKILNAMNGEKKEITSRGDILDKAFDKGEDIKNDSLKTTKLDSGLLKKTIKITKIGNRNSNFQASVFRNTRTKKVMIAYRGTDATHLLDWTLTNLSLGLQLSPDALTCAVWVYEKVATDPELKDYEIHVTGHSMGGALTQYIGCYGLKPTKPTVYEEYDINGNLIDLPLTKPVYKSVTWNGLGIGWKHKLSFDDHKKKHLKIYHDNYDYCHNATDKILNFYMKYDAVSDIQKGLGMRVLVDTIKAKDNMFIDEFACYHGLMCFLPFMDRNGNIVRDKLSKNFIKNAIKQTVLKDDIKKNIKLKRKNNDYKNIEDVTLNESNYLEEFDITEIDYETPLGNIYEDMQNKKKSGENLLYYIMKKNISEKDVTWYMLGKEYAEIGLFNNMSNIAGVEGGLPIRILLPEDEVIVDNKEIKEINPYINQLKSTSVQGFIINSYHKFIMTQEIGKHNAFVVEGEISEEEYKKHIYKNYIGNEINISLFNIGEDNQEKMENILMKGVIKNISFFKSRRGKDRIIHGIKINVLSATYLMDKEKKNKIFQNKKAIYDDLFKEFQSNYKELNICSLDKGELGNYYLQYNETDWQFLKRVASNLGKPLIVDRFIEDNKQRLTIGYYDESEKVEEVIECEDKIVKTLNKGTKVLQIDKVLRIGEYIDLYKIFADEEFTSNEGKEEQVKTRYFVKRMEAKLEGSLINYYYTLVLNNEANRLITPYFNKNLAGKSLMAEVLGKKDVFSVDEMTPTNGNLIDLNFNLSNLDNVEISTTNTDDINSRYLFSMVHKYVGQGKGSFVMPEIGDRVMVYYSTNDEKSAEISCGIRMEEDFIKTLHKPENKVLAIDNGQGIVLGKEIGTGIYGNNIQDVTKSTVYIVTGEKEIKMVSKGEEIKIGLSSSLMELLNGKSTLKIQSDTINLCNGGSDILIGKDSINMKKGTFKIGNEGVSSSTKIINQ